MLGSKPIKYRSSGFLLIIIYIIYQLPNQKANQFYTSIAEEVLAFGVFR